MKKKLRIPALAAFAIAVFLGIGLGAAAGTIYVPGGAPPGVATITDALAVASPGDKILVGSSYDSSNEKFPILVQKDNITIEADGTVEIVGEVSKAVFVVGAHRVYNPDLDRYEVVRVSGVTIKGFTITADDDDADGDFWDEPLADVGIVVKEADDVTIVDNYICATLEGIRLLDATGCTVTGNTVTKIGPYAVGTVEHYQGIGIFLEHADGNTLTSNTVTYCGLGLFAFESDSNTVSLCTFANNENGGIVLNDSNNSTLAALTVNNNDGWGVRFVFADTNVFRNSWVEGNEYGGVELLGSQGNTIEKNVVFSNGDPDSPNIQNDNLAQINVIPGDKALFTCSVFDDLETKHPFTASLEDHGFRAEKKLIESKLWLFGIWIADLDYELSELVQKTATAWGMADQAVQTSSLVAQIDKIIAEKRAIEKGEIYGTLSLPTKANDGSLPVEFTPGSKMDDPEYNFTLPEAADDFDERFGELTVADLNKYTNDGGTYDSVAVTDDVFGLDRDGTDEESHEIYDDEVSWSKLDILEIIKLAIRNEILFDTDKTGGAYVDLNGDDSIGDPPFAGEDGNDTIDSLKEKIWDYYLRGLILGTDKDDLLAKLDAILGYLAQINAIFVEIVDGLTTVNTNLDDAKAHAVAGEYTDAQEDLLLAKGNLEDVIVIKLGIYGIIVEIEHKLCLVNLELPPETRVNSTLVGKKEKSFREIKTSEIEGVQDDIVTRLNSDTNAHTILAAVYPNRCPNDFVRADIEVDHKGIRQSTGNFIASNVISSDVDNIGGLNIGIALASSLNVVVNNLITNEGVEPLDAEPRYAEVHRLDLGILLLSNENLISYNAIEFVDRGIKRGGDWDKDDYQTEYVFLKLAEVAYWPGPGEEIQGCGRPIPEEIASRPTDYISVLSVVRNAHSGSFPKTGTATVKRNRIALNFIEKCGVGIEIVDAESNRIDENLFYDCVNGGIVFAHGGHYYNIMLDKNDYFDGYSVVNYGTLPVDASKDYTPEDPPGYAPTDGEVDPPAGDGPFCYDNFGTIVKFTALEEWLSDRDITFDMEQYFSEGLPPNLDRYAYTVVLPEEKPRTCEDIFGEGPATPGDYCCDLEEGWNLISLPVDPADGTPAVVFDEVGDPLYLCGYNTGEGNFNWADDRPPSATAGTEGTLTEVGALGGYWLAIEDDGLVPEFCVDGTPLTGDQTINLPTAGWYLIGVPYDVAWGDVTNGGSIKLTRAGDDEWLPDAVTQGWIFGTVLRWNGADWDRITTTTGVVLVPCLGYWIRTRVDNLVMTFVETTWDPGNPPAFDAKGFESEDPGNPPMPGMMRPVSFAADKLEFTNYPNPVRDVHTTTFRVKGVMAPFVESIKVEIYDLSGRLVYQEEMPGATMDWHTDNEYGEYLANGVYLYKLYGLVDGTWHQSEVRKLAILR